MRHSFLYGRIIVPFDGSSGSWNALRKAVQLAKGMNAEITILSVEEPLPHYEETAREVQEERKRETAFFADLQSKAVLLSEEQGVHPRTEILAGNAAQIIIRRAQEENVDLIVIGQSGHSGVWGLLLGSTTARVVDHAQCDVLVVR